MSLREEYSPENDKDFDDVAPFSNKKYKWVCKAKQHQWEAIMANRTKGGGCPYCAGKAILPGYNDLFTVRPDLKKEWSPENTIDPNYIGSGSEKRVIWVCSQGHSFESIVWNRTKGHGCPYCQGKIPIPGETDLETLFPEIAAQYDQDKNKKPLILVTKGSSSKYWWKCSQGHSWQASVSNRTIRGDGCPHCSGRYAVPGKTDVASTHSHSTDRWHPDNEKTLEQVSAGSGYRGRWICPENPDHVWNAIVSSIIKSNASGCPRCWKGVSSQETEIYDYVCSLLPNTEVKQNVRNVIPPKELDIYIPELNFAIEFNGLYWHTEAQGKDRNYHKNKLMACEAAGVRLMTIWEDEWRNQKSIIKRMIKHRLNANDEPRVFARKTSVQRILKNEARVFLNENHIQGFCPGTEYLGLFSEQDLVAVMILRRLKNDYYLDRYATSKHVVGGQSKLLKWAQRNLDFEQMITFADLEISAGGLYEATGWVRDKVQRPDYKYLVDGERVHKFNYRLKRFRNDPNLLWEEGLTEKELAQLNGLERIWDCGKIRFVLPKTQM